MTDDAVVLFVTYAKLRAANAFHVAIDIVESRHVVAKPSISEECFDGCGFHDEFAHHEKIFQPATEVVHRVLETAPFATSGGFLAGLVELAEFFRIKFCAHTQFSPLF